MRSRLVADLEISDRFPFNSSGFFRAVDELLVPLSAVARYRLVGAIAWTLTEIDSAVREYQTARLNAEQRCATSWHLPTPEVTEEGRRLALVPCWPSRRRWLKLVREALASERGRSARRRNRRVSEVAVLAVALAHARYAESRTGRYCTASLATLAEECGWSKTDRVKSGRRVLAELGLLVHVSFGRHLRAEEIRAARELHGGTQLAVASHVALTVPAEHCTPSTPPTTPRLIRADRVSGGVPRRRRQCTPLSSCGSSTALELAKEQGTSQERQENRRNKPPRRPTVRRTPRPIALQRLAAQVLARTSGLDPVSDALKSPMSIVRRKSSFHLRKQHLGAICDVLNGAGIDPEVWTAAQVCRRLDLYAHSTGLTWPDEITNPAAYLRWRLGQLDWSVRPGTPAAPKRQRVRPIDSSPRTPPHIPKPASTAGRRSGYALAAQLCGWTTPDPATEVIPTPT